MGRRGESQPAGAFAPLHKELTLRLAWSGICVAVKKTMLPLLLLLGATLILAGGVSGAPAKQVQGCETPAYENGLDLVFGRAKSQAASDKISQLAVAVGFKGVETVQ